MNFELRIMNGMLCMKWKNKKKLLALRSFRGYNDRGISY